MADSANFDAIEFFRDGKRHIRLYYQSDDKTIRESSYHQDYGWYVAGDGAIATTAKSNSPIAVTRWTDDGGSTQIRVFYLDDNNNICEHYTELKADQVSPWQSHIIAPAADSEIAPDSQLAVARPDKDDTMLRVFYQEKSTDDKSASLRETRYDLRYRQWAVQDNPIVNNALPGSRLSAVSDKKKQDVRLYYQGTDLFLREIYCHDWRWDGASSIIRKQMKLAQKSPVSAVSWVSETLGLQIRVFVVTEAQKNAISQFSYSSPNWWSMPGPEGLYQQDSALACCRNTAADTADHNPICVFYQPDSLTISLKVMPAEADDLASSEMAAQIHQPAGVPKSRGAGRPQTDDRSYELFMLEKELSASKEKANGLQKALDTAQKDLQEAKAKIENISSSFSSDGGGMDEILERIRGLAAEMEKDRKEGGDRL